MSKAPDAGDIRQLKKLWVDSFGDHGGFWDLFLETAFEANHCRCIRENGQVRAGLAWLDCSCQEQKIAYVYAVVTHREHRGQGLCRQLLQDVHSQLAAQGYHSVLLVPEGEGLRQMYRKLGYRDCTRISEIFCLAGAAPLSLRAIGPEEYAALRRQFLPQGGVLQEGRNMTFLARQAQFYIGEDFLMAAWQEGNALTALELLGNSQAAPGILETLGLAQGTFRTPGEEKPFAMVYPLKEDAITPSYFGFAFD